jgi:hypothetical protein
MTPLRKRRFTAPAATARETNTMIASNGSRRARRHQRKHRQRGTRPYRHRSRPQTCVDACTFWGARIQVLSPGEDQCRCVDSGTLKTQSIPCTPKEHGRFTCASCPARRREASEISRAVGVRVMALVMIIGHTHLKNALEIHRDRPARGERGGSISPTMPTQEVRVSQLASGRSPAAILRAFSTA